MKTPESRRKNDGLDGKADVWIANCKNQTRADAGWEHLGYPCPQELVQVVETHPLRELCGS
ncbi:hypothetical protein SBA7_90003 [Candidatus Sulfotelmatobacter sp. SbA7]|nr:hypothetical protein SBA7_90003 [Candidatus Sulfotelmatobacter sp. SbA7]